MKLFILELYGDEHKWRGQCDVGYFTSKKALIREMKRHAEEIGEIWSKAHGVNTLEEHAEFDFRYFDSEFANIEIVETNSPI